MVAVELLHNGPAPRETGDMCRPQIERTDQRREAVGVVRQAEIRGHVRGATRPRLVPGHDGELLGQGGELRLPHAGIHRGAVHEHERRPFADALVGDLEPVRPNDLHRRNLHAGRGPEATILTVGKALPSPRFSSPARASAPRPKPGPPPIAS
jgi:hypothetical protein